MSVHNLEKGKTDFSFNVIYDVQGQQSIQKLQTEIDYIKRNEADAAETRNYMPCWLSTGLWVQNGQTTILPNSECLTHGGTVQLPRGPMINTQASLRLPAASQDITISHRRRDEL